MRLIINEKTGEVFEKGSLRKFFLNQTALEILNLANLGHDIHHIVNHLAENYEVDQAELRSVVSETLEDLRHKKLISRSAEMTMTNGLCFESWTPHVPILHIIQNCNSPCNICDCWKVKQKVRHSMADLAPLLDLLKVKGAKTIMLSGGEPLLHPELKEIIQYIKNLGLGVMLNSNGLILNRHTWLKEMEIDQLVVSMDGVDAQTYQKIRGVNAYDRVWNNLREFKELNPKTHVSLRFIVSEVILTRFMEYITKAKEFGIDGFGFSPADVDSESFSRSDMNPDKKKDLMGLLIPSLATIKSFIERLVPDDEIYEMLLSGKESGQFTWGPYDMLDCLHFYLSILRGDASYFDNQICSFPQYSMVLDYNGDIRPCFYSDKVTTLNEVKSRNFDYESSLKSLRDSGACQKCRGKVFCPSGKGQVL